MLWHDMQELPKSEQLQHYSLFGQLVCPSQEAKKRVIILVGVINSDFQWKIELLLHNEGKE